MEETLLAQKKEDLRARGILLAETKHKSVLAPGYNPKETPEMFVKKIMLNSKRMQNTIELYEQNQLNEKEQSEEIVAPQIYKSSIEIQREAVA